MITETSPIIIEWIPSCETTKIMRTKIQAMNRKGRPNKGKHEWEVTGEWMAAGVKRREGGKKTSEIRQFQVSFLFLVAVSIFDCQRSPTNESLASRRPSTPQKTPHEIPPLQFLFPFFFSLPFLPSLLVLHFTRPSPRWLFLLCDFYLKEKKCFTIPSEDDPLSFEYHNVLGLFCFLRFLLEIEFLATSRHQEDAELLRPCSSFVAFSLSLSLSLCCPCFIHPFHFFSLSAGSFSLLCLSCSVFLKLHQRKKRRPPCDKLALYSS